MRKPAIAACFLLALSLIAIASRKATPVHGASTTASTPWNRQAAAHYLDTREIWWQQWPPAQKDHGTLCISCHTTVPYAMARPGLRRDLGEAAMTAPEKTMRDSVEKRVIQWSEVVPFYSDARNGPGKTAEAHATEAVLNAIILANYDAQTDHLRPVTRVAFGELWALQESTGDNAGGWKWQDFHYGPWESTESSYQGAALLLLSTLNAPGGFATEPTTRQHLDRLHVYLRRQYAAQPRLNQLYILWASSKEPGLLTPTERETLLTALRTQQQPDGGWQTSALDQRERVDHTPQSAASDGYATALAILALQASGDPHHDPALQRGLAWLTAHQQPDGAWTAASLNKQRDPESDAYLFMTDAATAYAALALQRAH